MAASIVRTAANAHGRSGLQGMSPSGCGRCTMGERAFMFRRIPRVRAGVIACAATLAGLVSLLAAVAASAAPVPASAAPPASSSLTYMYNYYNQLCLDGREGPAGVTLRTCGTDGTHEVWRKNFYIGYWTLQNVYNGLFLGG